MRPTRRTICLSGCIDKRRRVVAGDDLPPSGWGRRRVKQWSFKRSEGRVNRIVNGRSSC